MYQLYRNIKSFSNHVLVVVVSLVPKAALKCSYDDIEIIWATRKGKTLNNEFKTKRVSPHQHSYCMCCCEKSTLLTGVTRTRIAVGKIGASEKALNEINKILRKKHFCLEIYVFSLHSYFNRVLNNQCFVLF